MLWSGAYLKLSDPRKAQAAFKRIKRGELPKGVTVALLGNLIVFRGPPEAMRKNLQPALIRIAKNH